MNLYRFIASDRELKDFNEENNEMKIVPSNDMSIVANYTSKKNCAYIEWNYNEQNAEKLITYIKEHLKICPRIELWNTNLNNKSNAIINKCSKHILTIDKIKEILGNDSFNETKCLVVYNS